MPSRDLTGLNVKLILATEGPIRDLKFANGRATRVSYGLLAFGIALVVGFAILYRPFDFDVYRWGGRMVTEGMRLYLDQAENISGLWFTYPPFAAILFIPIADIPVILARLAWELASVLGLGYATSVTLKLAGYRASWPVTAGAVAITMTLEPDYHTLFLGQVNLILLALILADIWRVARGRPAGIGIGITAAIKLTPLIFIPLLLLTRRTRDGLTATAAFITCSLIGYLVAPSDSGLYWHHELFDTGRVGSTYISNQSIYAAMQRLAGGPGSVGLWYYLIPVAAVMVIGLTAGAVLGRHGDWLGAATVAGATGLLISPVSWTHHWVWIAPALVILLRGGKRSKVAAGFGYLLFVIAPMWFTPLNGHAAYGFHGAETIVANCYPIAGLAFLGYMCWRAYATWRDARGSQPSEPRPPVMMDASV